MIFNHEDADINAVAEYLVNGFKGEQPMLMLFVQHCHGADGNGREYVGPNIRAYDDAF